MAGRHEVLALIPARGGSKGVPRKNVLEVAGKPLIAWTLEACASASCVTRVVVSTDDPEIAEVSNRFGAEVVHRPASISGDAVAVEPALLHALGELREREQYIPDYVAFLQCTSPLTAPEDIDGAFAVALRENADTVVAVTDFHYFLWNEGSPATGINHSSSFRPRRQDREPQYLETGAVYILRTEGFLRAQHRFFDKIALYHMPAERVLEIDEWNDFRRAEFLLLEQQRQRKMGRLPETVRAMVFDFDGVFTDNRVGVNEHGEELVWCSRADGVGLSACRDRGIEIVVISRETNPVVQARCRKLGVECMSGVKDKAALLGSWLADRNIAPEDAIYLGNDIHDLEAMGLVGCGIAVADAEAPVRDRAAMVLERNGGYGAVRELCDLVIQQAG